MLLGSAPLSATSLSALDTGAVFSIGTATASSVVLGVTLSLFLSVGTASGTATVFSNNIPIAKLAILRGMSKQPVNGLTTMSKTPVSILGNF